MKALAFKRAYARQWPMSNQKEAFVEMFFKALGFHVVRTGLGVESSRMIKASGSLPDFAIYESKKAAKPLLYVEVTGANKGFEKSWIYITLSKFLKFRSLSEREAVPVAFIYLGFRTRTETCSYKRYPKLVFSGYAYLEDLYPYAENPKYIILKNFYGPDELFIKTPPELWKPLPRLAQELLQLRGCC